MRSLGTLHSKPTLPIVLGLTAALLLTGCKNREGLAERAERTQDPSAEDAARFLAGLPGRPDGEFASLERTRAWQNYASQYEIPHRIAHPPGRSPQQTRPTESAVRRPSGRSCAHSAPAAAEFTKPCTKQPDRTPGGS
jgi:hypothetical protein